MSTTAPSSLDSLDIAILGMEEGHRYAMLELATKGRDRFATTSPNVAWFWAIIIDRLMDGADRIRLANDRIETELMLGLRDSQLEEFIGEGDVDNPEPEA